MAESQSWQQTKSLNTQTLILDAALACFHARGYANTSTEHIAQQAGVSRGAMLHHFPTRRALISAAVEHLHSERLEQFREEGSRVQSGAQRTRIAAGIEAYWEQLKSPLFTVLQELRMASRTDPELAAVLTPMLDDYEQELFEATRQIFPDLALSESFARTVSMSQYLLEGMAAAKASGQDIPEEKMLSWLIRELRRSYQDVRSPTDG